MTLICEVCGGREFRFEAVLGDELVKWSHELHVDRHASEDLLG